jgi:N-acetyl-anhydromuramyl-L-alanine amidase AmpD
MGKYRPSGKVIIGGQEFQTDAKIVNFREGPRWDATIESCIATETDPNPFAKGCTMQAPGKYAPYDGFGGHKFTRRYQGRPALQHSWNRGVNAPYDAAKQVIRQFMIHHDGCATADMCFSVLQNERGLSCHFLVDNDGTIFQTLDLALEGWHGSELNASSIGVELCNRGDAAKEPTYYSRKNQSRDVKPCKINNHVIKSYDFTKEQKEEMRRLARALLRLLPNLPAEYPQASPGQAALDTVGYAGLARFSGYIGHYHLTTNKWDPGPWDFKEFCEGIRGAFSFPLFPRGTPQPNQTQPVVPSQANLVKEEAELLYKLNEQRADGGYFPVGPWGDSRLWHGGIHLATAERAKVFAPFPGRLVAARMGASSPIGSVNFVLVRHQMSLADRKLEFYSLYMHLADEMKASDPAEWLAKARIGKDGKPRELKSGEVWLLDEAIEAGAHIGHVGVAGPGDLAKPQLHLELFANSDLFEGMPAVPWETIDGSSGGRFCDAARINDIIDGNKDLMLSREELKSFYTSGGAATHYLVTRHVSEWTADPSWSESLRLPKDFRHLKPAAIDALVAEQITPGLWWDDKTAAHCKLPPDGVVYHYHPISFVRWLNEKLIEAAGQAAPGFDASKAGAVPEGITDDREGVGMASKDAFVEDTCNGQLTLKELVQGFDAPECKP